LYRDDVFPTFMKNELIFDNINKYVMTIKNNNLLCKELLESEEYQIYGEVDMIDVSNNKIIDFKCSNSENFNLDWLIQLLAYCALIRLYSKIEINNLEVYNPLKGLLFTFDVSSWNKEKQ